MPSPLVFEGWPPLICIGGVVARMSLIGHPDWDQGL